MSIGDLFGALGRAATRPVLPKDGTRAHRISTTIGAEQIDGWIEYELAVSMLEPADGFQMTRPFSKRAWDLCRPDEAIRVAIDGVVMLDGFIDDRARSAADGTIEISGRDRAGRLVQESIPKVTGFDGLQLTEAIRQLAAPWFTTVSLSDARNRAVRRGKGHRAAAAGEPAILPSQSNTGRLDPGETRWNVIEQLCSSVGLLCWSSADGRELVVGQPNYKQAIQYLFRHSARNGSTVKDLRLRESVAERYALIEVHGAGAGDADNFGESVTSRKAVARDGFLSDGTGNSFRHPKRLLLSQAGLSSTAEAQLVADREMRRRNFHARLLTVEAPLHGQLVAGTVNTLFAPNTLARVIDDDLELDETWLIYACSFRGSRRAGETTSLMLVPRGTELVA